MPSLTLAVWPLLRVGVGGPLRRRGAEAWPGTADSRAHRSFPRSYLGLAELLLDLAGWPLVLGSLVRGSMLLDSRGDPGRGGGTILLAP